jgi:ATP-binding cassette, subfamily C, bacterial LapB
MPEEATHKTSDERRTSRRSSASSVMGNYDTLMYIARDMRHLPRSILVSSLIINLLALALPLSVSHVYDRILPNKSVETLWSLMLGLCCLVLLECAMKIARVGIMRWWTLRTGVRSEVEALSRFLLASKQDISREGKHIWLESMDSISDLNKFYGSQAQLILLDIPFILIYLLVMLLVGGPLTLVPVALTFVFVLHIGNEGERLQRTLQNRSHHDVRRYDFITECLGGMNTLKTYVMEPQMQRRFERLQESSLTNSFATILSSNYIQSLGSLFSNLMLVCVVGVGALLVMHGTLSVGAVACFSLLSSRLSQPVLRGIGIWTELQNVAVAHQRAAPLFALLPPPMPALAGERLKGAISLKDVSLAREGRDVALRNVSLDIQPGQIIGLRGSERSGRSELIKILRGDLQPESGTVRFDGHDLSGGGSAAMALHICYVSNPSPLFQGTVLQNIAMFRSGGALENGRTAARLIGLEDDIFALPDGYETAIGERNEVFSEGFQQRVAIARALAQRPAVLLFDEANAKLDRASDQKLKEGLERIKGQTTIIVASNRPSFLTICDAIYDLTAAGLILVKPDGSPIDASAGLRSGGAKADGGAA